MLYGDIFSAELGVGPRYDLAFHNRRAVGVQLYTKILQCLKLITKIRKKKKKKKKRPTWQKSVLINLNKLSNFLIRREKKLPPKAPSSKIRGRQIICILHIICMMYLCQEGESVGPHHLPDQGKGQALVPLHDIWACNKGQLQNVG